MLTATFHVEATGDVDVAITKLIKSFTKEQRAILGTEYSARVTEVKWNGVE